MRIHVGYFGYRGGAGRKVCICRVPPFDIHKYGIVRLMGITPSIELSNRYANSGLSWSELSGEYMNEIMRNCESFGGSDISERLFNYFAYVCGELSSDELLLLCVEKDFRLCHRRLLYEWLPNGIRGECR